MACTYNNPLCMHVNNLFINLENCHHNVGSHSAIPDSSANASKPHTIFSAIFFPSSAKSDDEMHIWLRDISHKMAPTITEPPLNRAKNHGAVATE